MADQEKWETVIELAGEGGSITLLGMKKEARNWVFKRETNEMFSLNDLDDEPIVEKQASKGVRTLKPTIRISYEAENWNEAKKIIEDYPLEHLGPMNVHPEFSHHILELAFTRNFQKHRLFRWAKACFPTINHEIFELYFQLMESKHTVFLTGAGMSVESGIPDFRSETGWWKNINPLTVATIDALEDNYDLFHEFYSTRIKALETCNPHEGHQIIAELQRKGFINRITTQNVDALHEAGGSENIDHLHGSILTYRCHECGNKANKQQFLEKESCSFCHGKLRPNVVLFGESLPEFAWNNALSHIQQADLVIVIGTSLKVYPVSQLPSMTKGKTVYINKEVSDHQSFFDLVIEGSARDTLVQVDKLFIGNKSSNE